MCSQGICRDKLTRFPIRMAAGGEGRGAWDERNVEYRRTKGGQVQGGGREAGTTRPMAEGLGACRHF